MSVVALDNARQAELFLREYYGTLPEGIGVSLFTLPSKRSHTFNTSLPTQKYINGLVQAQQNVYFQMCGVPHNVPPTKRAQAHEVLAMFGLWWDIDYGTGHKKKSLPKNEEEARKIIDALPIKPTFLVNSGNGFHGHTVFKEPWVFTSDSEWRDATELSQRFGMLVHSVARSIGDYSIDSVHDLARILRVPGTLNFKSDPPKPVTILEHNDYRINIADIVNMLPELPAAEATVHRQRAFKGNASGVQINGDADAPKDKFEALIANNEDFSSTWHHKRRLKDSSPSGWDMSLALFAARAQWEDQEIGNLLVHHRRKYGFDLKFDRPDYYAATVAKAKECVRKTCAMDKLEATKEVPAEAPDDKASITQLLASTLNVPITAIKRFVMDPPEYYIETTLGSVSVKSTEILLSQTKLRNMVAAACKRAFPKFSTESWHTITQRILDACIDVEVGMSNADYQITGERIARYLSERGISRDKDTAHKSASPFQHKGFIFIHADQFMRWLKTSLFVNTTRQELNKHLTQLECDEKVLNFKDDKNSSGKTTASYWRLHNATFGQFVVKEDEE